MYWVRTCLEIEVLKPLQVPFTQIRSLVCTVVVEKIAKVCVVNGVRQTEAHTGTARSSVAPTRETRINGDITGNPPPCSIAVLAANPDLDPTCVWENMMSYCKKKKKKKKILTILYGECEYTFAHTCIEVMYVSKGDDIFFSLWHLFCTWLAICAWRDEGCILGLFFFQTRL